MLACCRFSSLKAALSISRPSTNSPNPLPQPLHLCILLVKQSEEETRRYEPDNLASLPWLDLLRKPQMMAKRTRMRLIVSQLFLMERARRSRKAKSPNTREVASVFRRRLRLPSASVRRVLIPPPPPPAPSSPSSSSAAAAARQAAIQIAGDLPALNRGPVFG
ncbi:hypothetical protein NL676_034059 [Syzygium grande]|nr:hypothetical protein NL676_034059 [Syzygium grande]